MNEAAPRLDVAIVEGIDKIPRDAWDNLLTPDDSPFVEWDWLRAMEDSGSLQALTFLNQAGRVDLQRVLVLRTVSNYDREPPGTTVADSLKEMLHQVWEQAEGGIIVAIFCSA